MPSFGEDFFEDKNQQSHAPTMFQTPLKMGQTMNMSKRDQNSNTKSGDRCF